MLGEAGRGRLGKRDDLGLAPGPCRDVEQAKSGVAPEDGDKQEEAEHREAGGFRGGIGNGRRQVGATGAGRVRDGGRVATVV